MTEPSTTGVFAFDVPVHQPSAPQVLAHPSTENAQDYVAPIRYQAKDVVAEDPQTIHDMNTADMQLDPELQPRAAPDQTERPASHRIHKTPLVLQPPYYSIMATSTNGTYKPGNDFAPPTRPSDHDHTKLQKFYSSDIAWPHAPGLTQASHEQLHSAPISGGNILQTYQTSYQPLQHSTVPPATAPLTVGNVTNGFQHYAPQFSTYNGHTTGPLQFQQSSYTSAPATQAASPVSGQGHWYYQAPITATATSAIRPGIQHMHSVPSIPTTAAYSPIPTHDGSESGTGYPRLRSFAELQQEANGVPATSQQWTAPMMVREAVRPMEHSRVYGPSVSQSNCEPLEIGGLPRAASCSQDPSREQSTRPREELEEEEEEAPNTSKQLTTYNDESPDRRTLRQRKSTAGSSRAMQDEDRDWEHHRQAKATRGRPKKKAKREEQSLVEDEEVVAVKANGKGNQFILTLYAMVDAPSSYPLIGWNLPGTAIVIPDSKGFAAELLNKYFRHGTISSFARQLVSYGFLKTELPAREKAMVTHGNRADSKHWTFSHDFFLRGRADLLDQVAPPGSPGKPQKIPYGKKSLAAAKREEEAFVEVLKRENTHWRERCQRLEQCMLEEKARANQYFAILVERGLIPGAQSLPQPMLPLQVLPLPAIPMPQSPVMVEVPVEKRDKSEESARPPACEEDEVTLKATDDSGRDQVGQTEDPIERPPSA